ncbi:hypothetical protein GCM10010300_24960 [Streptomyces olivaceoviridis]|nr:hypothetical protein GCM10010300_24960 [Streptomyces olivaceoviridis]
MPAAEVGSAAEQADGPGVVRRGGPGAPRDALGGGSNYRRIGGDRSPAAQRDDGRVRVCLSFRTPADRLATSGLPSTEPAACRAVPRLGGAPDHRSDPGP